MGINATEKIFDIDRLLLWKSACKSEGKKLVFTNGCFDILHEGHVMLLEFCRQQGDVLVVAVNSDASVKNLKGETRPVNTVHSRAMVLAALQAVDAVVVFNEDTPLDLIKQLQPDVLVKGGDYNLETIVGADVVSRIGGKVVLFPLHGSFSTTSIVSKLSKH